MISRPVHIHDLGRCEGPSIVPGSKELKSFKITADGPSRDHTYDQLFMLEGPNGKFCVRGRDLSATASGKKLLNQYHKSTSQENNVRAWLFPRLGWFCGLSVW
ncbi:hypothetical protein VTK56DRAFT_6436 [Thermocarpiscus australiensis]